MIFHSDRGSQYASGDFQKQLSAFGMRGSMSRKGDCWDNAVTETLFGSLKVERLHGMRFETRRQAKDEVIEWLRFYNYRRLHSTLGYLSPMDFEKKRLVESERLVALTRNYGRRQTRARSELGFSGKGILFPFPSLKYMRRLPCRSNHCSQ